MITKKLQGHVIFIIKDDLGITSSRLQERSKRMMSMSLGNIRRDISYKPSNANFNNSNANLNNSNFKNNEVDIMY